MAPCPPHRSSGLFKARGSRGLLRSILQTSCGAKPGPVHPDLPAESCFWPPYRNCQQVGSEIDVFTLFRVVIVFLSTVNCSVQFISILNIRSCAKSFSEYCEGMLETWMQRVCDPLQLFQSINSQQDNGYSGLYSKWILTEYCAVYAI